MLNIFVLFLQIEYGKTCSYDYVDVYEGLDDYSGRRYGRYCGQNVSITKSILINLRPLYE